MARAKRDIPHYYLDLAIDMSRTQSWLTEQNLNRPVTTRLLAAALLIKAVALAVREVPEMNGFYADDAFRPGSGIHVGMAISLRGGGLVAPAIHDADRKSVDALMAAFRDVTQRARAGSLRSSEISDATITVTSLGDTGVDRVFGIIYPPQVALVGFGTITERPWADGGTVGARSVMVATLAADHRVSDGHRGARFLTVINRLLQAPEQL
jgi:pyruvate dehydrogenase E2 component (dihydrolipoamide acetyltransferase)